MNPEDQKLQARELYFQTDLNQSQIAAEVGVSQKTVSLWVSAGRWATLKEMSRNTPAMMVDNMYAELVELNNAIQTREPGKRFATREEADIRRKLLLGIRCIQQQQSAGSHMEVLLNFIEFLKRSAPALTKEITLLADSYLCGEKSLGREPRFQSYDLPAHEQAPETATEELAQNQVGTIPEEQAAPPVPPAPPVSPAPVPPPTPQPPRSPLLYPITPYTVVWPPVKAQEKPKTKNKIPPHLKGADRQAWTSYVYYRQQFLGPDKPPTKV